MLQSIRYFPHTEQPAPSLRQHLERNSIHRLLFTGQVGAFPKVQGDRPLPLLLQNLTVKVKRAVH